MDIEKLALRYLRLRQDLSIAYNSRPWNRATVDRLANEIARIEREIAALRSTDQEITA
jgi:cell division protein FtsB